MENILKGLEPQSVLNYFEKISQIPRGSGNEKAISDYLCNFAKELNLEYIQDEHLNVIIKKPATEGYENCPGVIIQGHMDMVCEKNKDSNHDFLKDPIQLRVVDDMIYATGTTLGADNGIAVAYGMALLASNTIKHPELEILITTDEEVGMTGAKNLDTSVLTGKYMLNLDSEEEGKITVSCAGGVTAIAKIKKELKDISDKDIFAINIKGLKGGHSGIEIDKKRANSNILMGRILNNLKNSDVDYDLISISGGLKNNAIPREAEAIIALDKEYVEQANDIVTSMLGIFKNEFKTSDPSIVVEMQKIDEKHERALSEQVQDKIVKVLNLMPRNIQTMSADIEGLVESSTNLGVVVTENEYIKFEFATRSSVKSLKDDINERMELLCESIGVELELEDDYPEWEYAKDSKLEQICVETYEKLYNKKPEIVAIHAGLECGLLLDAIEGAQAISIGPNLFDVHTPDEHIDILSTERTWDYLVSILCNIK